MLRIDKKLVFLDIEATSLDVSVARPWEIAMIERSEGVPDRETLIKIRDVDLCYADPRSLEIGRFEERHVNDGNGAWLTEAMAALWVSRRLTDRCLVVGSNVAGYDLPILQAMLTRQGEGGSWDHHPVDLVTWAQAREASGPFRFVDLSMGSYALSRLSGVEPPAAEVAHTAMGDALWARRWWDAMTAGVVAS